MLSIPLTNANSIMITLSVALLIAASLYDVAARIIPDPIPAVLAGIGVVLRIADGSWPDALLTGFVVFSVMMVCCLRGWLGGGDVKLLTAVSLLLPPSLVPTGIFWIGVAGGLLAICYILLRRVAPRPGPRPASRLARIWRAEMFRVRRGGPLPYGVGIAAGAIVVLLQGAA